VFSFDSVITAVGMANELWVMVIAVVIAVIIMLVASGPIMRFIHAHPTVKMLALAFVLLIGFDLVAEGFEFHIPKGYLYAAMAFSVLVESLNVIVSRRRARVAAQTAAAHMDQPVPTDVGVVLIPLDGSKPALRALEEVVALVRRGYAFDIHLVNVQPALRTPVGSQDAIRDYMTQHAETIFAPARNLLRASGLSAAEHVVTGPIGERIVRQAAELRAVRIVMGSHGRDRISELILGSVATEVLRQAICPVTLVK
jgi:nucleotide-binding universal stress UspA family protein